ncbi:MAG: hypothetical protein M1826_000894 [Phylliscum demangeonii]|nr:MAG: hypothetical protein M1826_000894 [Phylliscum demangeonii]
MCDGTIFRHACGHTKEQITVHCYHYNRATETCEAPDAMRGALLRRSLAEKCPRCTFDDWERAANARFETIKHRLARAEARYADDNSSDNLSEVHHATDTFYQIRNEIRQQRDALKARLGITGP